MKPAQYLAAKEQLGLSHPEMGRLFGKHWYASYRYAAGHSKVPKEHAKLVRLLVLARLTVSDGFYQKILRKARSGGLIGAVTFLQASMSRAKFAKIQGEIEKE